jgi:hypothetical protein
MLNSRVPATILVVLPLALCTIVLLLPSVASEGPSPTILVYAHGLPNFREAMVEELRKDERIAEEVIAVESAGMLRTLLRLPNIKAVVMAGGDMPMFTALENSILQFFDEGGGLVAFHDFGNTIMAGTMAETVFPLRANSTKMGKMKEGKMQHELVRQDIMEINREGPSGFPLFDHEINLAWDANDGSCVYHPPSQGEHWVLYGDAEYEAPVILAYKNIGLSVAFANGDVSDSAADRFRYFGNFFFDESFLTLFLNSVAWVKNGETRTESLEQELAALEAEEQERQDFLSQADRERRSRRLGALAIRTVLTLMGLVGIVIAYMFLIRRPPRDGIKGGGRPE